MRLAQPLALNAIAVFRGVADFYYWKGIPCVRRWPRAPIQPNSDAQVRSRLLIAQMHLWLKSRSLSWHAAWRNIALPPARSIADLQRKTTLWAAARGLTLEPPEILYTAWLSLPEDETQAVVIKCQPYKDTSSPANTAWRWRPWTPGEPTMTYYLNGKAKTRQHYYTSQVFLVRAGLAAPLSSTWKPSTSTWYIEIPNGIPACIVIPFHKDVFS